MRAWSIICTLLLFASSYAQPYGNEWIDYDQSYYRIKIHQTGVYRLDYTALQAAGIPLSSISNESWELIGRESEQPIHIVDGGDGSLDPGDYLEFFAEKNNGWMDSLLYADPSGIGNPHYSLVNDTIHFFLTWNDELDNSRVMVENGQDFQNYLSPDFITKDIRSVFSEQYNYGRLLAANNNIPDYVTGEGWMGARFGLGAGSLTKEVALPTGNPATSGVPAAVGRTVFASANNANINGDNHHIRIFRGENNDVQLSDLSFEGYQMHTVPFSIPAGQMSDETYIQHVVIDDLDAPADQFRVAYTEITYAHLKDVSDMSTLDFRIGVNPTQDKYHLDLTGLGLASPVIYALGANAYRITGQYVDGALDLLVPDQGNGSRLFIADEDQVVYPSLQPVGQNGQFTDFGQLEPDSAFIIVHHAQLQASAQVYATYRTNSAQDAVLADVDELYDQFGGGIPKHFIGIRRFCEMALETWNEPPGHLFLLGKSVFFEPQGTFAGARKSADHYGQSLVPSFGSPGSDILFTSGLSGPTLTPAIPTGRLSAITPAEVSAYLDKVVYNESRDPAAWMKNVLHFGGGTTLGEQIAFAGYLSDYEEIIEDTCYGGFVHTFLKESSLPIVVNLSDSISDIIQEGVSILTFFGHAGGGQFDQSIDDPANLEWGAHPMVIVNSCFSGDIHKPGHLSTSEDYVILPDKGAIGFIASVQQGFEGYLDAYSTELYQQISRKNYGSSIGYLMQQTIDSLSMAGFNQDEARASLLMNLLEGDPAVPIFSPDRPDLSVDQSSLSFFPEVVTALVDSITVQVVITNIGKATDRPFEVELLRTYPDGTVIPFGQSMSGLRFRDTLEFRIPTDFGNSFGINEFKVQVDLPGNVIPEIDNFFNNTTTRSLPITDGGVFPVYPSEFAIIPEPTVTLKASTGNPFIEERTYRMQLDTTDLFDSGYLMEYEANSIGGVLEWSPAVTLEDSLVCFWRVAEVQDDPSEIDWRESSFQYIPERTGWSQAHYYQFKSNRFNNLVYDRPERDFDFLSGTKNLSCEVYGNGISVEQSSEYFIDFQSVEYNGCGTTQAFHVAVIDPVTLEPWGTRYNGENPDHDFGNANDDGACRSRVEYYFIFRQNNAEQMAGFQNMIENEIPDGHIVLIYSWRSARPAWWPTYLPEFSEIFFDFGAEAVADIETDVPFITIGVKGDPAQTLEIVGDTINSFIELDFAMPVSGNSGDMRSPRIGPAYAWNRLYWQGVQNTPNDSATVTIIGVNSEGSETPISGGSFDISVEQVLDLQALVDAQEYPYIRLNTDLFDPVDQDPVQLKRWQVLYEPVPEAALNPALQYSFHKNTLQEGEDLTLTTAISNISGLDMDSLLVKYWIETSSNDVIPIPYSRQDSLRSGEHLIDTIQLNTQGLSGRNSLWVEVNPINELTGEFDQLEQYHFNNLGQLRFTVNEDRINPILDVTFDGVHILDGDLISARPEILIRLDDENPYLLMDDPSDTSFFSVFLTDPFGSQKRVYFMDGMGNEQMTFIPANGESNISDIIYRPDLIYDGEYRLLVVASDKSGNRSGDVNYKINFEVDHASSITEVLNYPNPFTTSTRFVFTLTGVEVPDRMKIQIMTVTGKVVREIFKDELGDIRIGRNITDFAWDGTDEYGDRLANGVYLYRVIVKDNGEDVDVRATAASTFFKKGFGKMYLMR